MKKIKKIIAFTVILIMFVSSSTAAGDITFAHLPLENPEKIFREMKSFLDYPEKGLVEGYDGVSHFPEIIAIPAGS